MKVEEMVCIDDFFRRKKSSIHTISSTFKLLPLKISLAFFDKGLHAFAHIFG
jgi:hypothetical protein